MRSVAVGSDHMIVAAVSDPMTAHRMRHICERSTENYISYSNLVYSSYVIHLISHPLFWLHFCSIRGKCRIRNTYFLTCSISISVFSVILSQIVSCSHGILYNLIACRRGLNCPVPRQTAYTDCNTTLPPYRRGQISLPAATDRILCGRTFNGTSL